MIPYSKHWVVLVCCFYSSEVFATTETHDCGIEYYDGTLLRTDSTTTYSDTILCNTVSMQMLDGADAVTLTGENDVYYDTSTNSYKFINNDSTAQQFAKATILINAAFQAAGVGVQFKGWKYEYKVYKSGNSTLAFKMEIKDGDTLVYARTQSFTGTIDGTDYSAEDIPPFLINITDTYTFVATMTGDTAGDGIGDLKFHMVYKTLAGHEQDFDPNFTYPGQTTALTFEEECEANSQYSPACYNYISETNEFDGQDNSMITGDDGSSVNPDPTVGGGLDINIADDGNVIIDEIPIISDNLGVDDQILTGVDDGQPANDGSDIFDDDIGLPPINDTGIPDVTNVLEDLSLGIDLEATTGIDLEATTGIDVQEPMIDVLEDSIQVLPEPEPMTIEELEPSIDPILDDVIEVEELIQDSIPNVTEKPSNKKLKNKALTIASETATAAQQVATDSSYQSLSADGISASGTSMDSNTLSSGGFADSSGGSSGTQSSTGSYFSNNQTSLQQTDAGVELLSGSSDVSLIASSGLSAVDITNSAEYGSSVDFGFSQVSVESSLPVDIVARLNIELNTLIDNVTKDVIEESDNGGLNEVSEEQLGMQQNLEDELVEKALGGDTSEEAKAALLGYNPKIRDYQQSQMPDGNYYETKDIYNDQRVFDNPSQRFFTGASDETHNKMVREQYERN
jgi:hypothetical protein